MVDPGSHDLFPGRGPTFLREGEGVRLRTAIHLPTSHAGAVLGLFQRLGQASPNESPAFVLAVQHLSENYQEGRSRNLEETFAQISTQDQAALRDRLGRRLEEFLSLSRERDGVLFNQGLLQIAGRFEDGEKYSEAGFIYSDLASRGATLASSVSEPILRRAQQRLGAMQGTGALGARLAFQFRNFATRASDPSMIVGFGLGSLVAGTVRLGALSGLLSSPSVNFLTRGPGASLAASSLALAAEVPAVWAATHGTNILLGRESGFNLDHAGEEMVSLGILLGSVRGSGALTQGLFRRIHGVDRLTGAASRLEGFSRVSEPIAHQFGMFSGIFLSRVAEMRLGMRPPQDISGLVADSLATLVDFNVGGHLASRVLGPGYARFLGELEFRTRGIEEMGGNNPSLLNWGWEGLSPEGLKISIPEAADSNRDVFNGPMLMATVKQPGSTSRVSSLSRVNRASFEDAVVNPAKALRYLEEATSVQAQKLVREIHREGRALDLILEMERNGYSVSIQDMVLDVKPLDFSEAIPRLRKLEADFAEYHAIRSQGVSENQYTERFREWQKVMAPADSTALIRLMQMAKQAGIRDVFDGAFQLRRAAIDLNVRVRKSSELARYYYDLSLVRDFLIGEGFNQVGKGNAGRRFSELLLNREGNCVTLSLLFAHLARKLGHELSFGLLPNHLYLLTKGGGAIESTLDFGMTGASTYDRKAIGAERGAQAAHQILGFHLLNLGKIFLSEGNQEAGGESFNLASQLLPKNPRPPLELGKYHVEREEYTLALEQFRRLVELYPEAEGKYGPLRIAAWQSAINQDYPRAERLFKQMNDLQPGDLSVYRGLEWIYRSQKRNAEAEYIRDMAELLKD